MPKDQTRDEYLGERHLLIDLELQAAQSLDKIILTLASGALILSLTFLRDVAGPPQGGTRWQLVGSWVAFAMALLLVLIACLCSQMSMAKQRCILDQTYGEECAAGKLRNWWIGATNLFTWSSVALLAGGIFLLLLFSYNNLPGGEPNMPKEKRVSKSPERRSMPAPSLPAKPAKPAPKPPKSDSKQGKS